MNRIDWKKLREHEGDALLTFLHRVEEGFVRAIYGIWLFIVVKVPEVFRHLFAWLHEKFFYVCRVVVRMSRLVALVAVWLAIVFGPVVVYTSSVTGAWVLFALAGSAYGVRRQIKKHNGTWTVNKEGSHAAVLNRVPTASLHPDPDQPRKDFDEAGLLALGESVKQYGQQIPLIVHGKTILDGERRWRAAQLVGLAELDVIVLSTRPTATELRLLQMSIDVHRASLSPIERSDFLARIKQENNWSVQELAERLSMKQPLVTKLLKFGDGCEELRGALHAGQIDQDKAYTICQEPDHGKQRELLKRAGDLTREQMRQKARNNGDSVEIKASVARFPLPTGTVVTIQGKKMTLAGAIDAMLETVKELKKGQSEHWDITTAMRVFKDRARAGN